MRRTTATPSTTVLSSGPARGATAQQAALANMPTSPPQVASGAGATPAIASRPLRQAAPEGTPFAASMSAAGPSLSKLAQSAQAQGTLPGKVSWPGGGVAGGQVGRGACGAGGGRSGASGVTSGSATKAVPVPRDAGSLDAVANLIVELGRLQTEVRDSPHRAPAPVECRHVALRMHVWQHDQMRMRTHRARSVFDARCVAGQLSDRGA